MSAQERSDLAEDRTDLAEDRTVLAHERSFAGWVRTGMGAVALGLGFNALFRTLEPVWIAKAIATAFLLIAIFVSVRRTAGMPHHQQARGAQGLEPFPDAHPAAGVDAVGRDCSARRSDVVPGLGVTHCRACAASPSLF